MNPLAYFKNLIIIGEYEGDNEPAIYSGIYCNNRTFIKDLMCGEAVYHTTKVQVFKIEGFDELNLIMKRTVIDCPRNVENPLNENDQNLKTFFSNTLSEFCIAKIASTHSNSISPFFIYYTRLITQDKIVSEYFMEDGGLTVNRYIESIHKSNMCQEYIMSILLDSANILFYLESHKIAHNDIKITNFVFDPKKANCKLIDYGVSIWSPNDSRTLFHNKPKGFSRNYASPEIFDLENPDIPEIQKKPIDLWKSDIYAWGIFAFLILTGIKETSEQFEELRKNTPEEFTHILQNMLYSTKFFVHDEMGPKLRLLLSFCLQTDPSKRITFKTLRNILFKIQFLSLNEISDASNNSLKLPLTTNRLEPVCEIVTSKGKPKPNRSNRNSPFKYDKKWSKTPNKGNYYSEQIYNSPDQNRYCSPIILFQKSLDKATSSIKAIQEHFTEILKHFRLLNENTKENVHSLKSFNISQVGTSPSKIASNICDLEKNPKSNIQENYLEIKDVPNFLLEDKKIKISKSSLVISNNVTPDKIPISDDNNFESTANNYLLNANDIMNKEISLIDNLNQFINKITISKRNNGIFDEIKDHSIAKKVIEKCNKIFNAYQFNHSIKDLNQIPQAIQDIMKSLKEILEQSKHYKLKLHTISNIEYRISDIIKQIENYIPFSNREIKINKNNFHPYNTLIFKINDMIKNIQNKSKKSLEEEKIKQTQQHEVEIEKIKREYRYEMMKCQNNWENENHNLKSKLKEQDKIIQSMINQDKLMQLENEYLNEIENVKIKFTNQINETIKKEQLIRQEYSELQMKEKEILKEVNNIIDNDNNMERITTIEEIHHLLFKLKNISPSRVPDIKVDLQYFSKETQTPQIKSQKMNLNEHNKNISPPGISTKQYNHELEKNLFTNTIPLSIKNFQNIVKETDRYKLFTNPRKYSKDFMRIISENKEKWDFSTCKFNTNEELNEVLQMIGQSSQIKNVNLNISGNILFNDSNITTLEKVLKGHKSLQYFTINCEKIPVMNIYNIGLFATKMPQFHKIEIYNCMITPEIFSLIFPRSKINNSQKIKGNQKIDLVTISK